ncbi:16S rRNA (cytosine(967)-C(5))-methyltransferase RsmB [Parasutterella muris]|uniref:16S rRNA (cytosine(967)-C(5))-methyltransferase RsmB n=1 Tax=Parasutterella muris TaxID=2565572 RepID=UPI0020402CE4|nr:16S rRNA (cytosine(967)-C(5))-methyltransferase RsmB [Parasutterella muris]
MKSGSLAEALVRSAAPWISIKGGVSLDKALSEIPRDAAYRGACQNLLYCVSRRRAFAEAAVAKLVSRAPDAKTAALLELSISLLKEGKEQEFTVCNQAVIAAKSDPQTMRAANFVNAILRRYLREKRRLTDELERSPVVRYNAPMWWIRRYEAVFGKSSREIFSLQRRHPPLTLRVNKRKAALEDVLADYRAKEIVCVPEGMYGLRLEEPRPVRDIPGFADGLVSVQDAGSQLAAPILGAKDGMRVLDACAAPGGKTAHILELADVDLTALEIDPLRAVRITENLDRLGLKANVRVADASDIQSWWDGKPFDRILLDAPCTASGIVRRHPDIPWSRKPEDIAQLARTQAKLLENLWPLLVKGGRILYAVCSVFSEEGPAQIESFCSKHPDAKLIPIGPDKEILLSLPPAEGVQDKPEFFPKTHDGFFYALIEKI